jgi:uncharacterized protein
MIRFLWATLVGLPSWSAILAVRCYQIFVSPLLGRNCRFTPTCSSYFIQAVRKYGFVFGSARGFWRIARCNPFHPGGHDPP